MCSGGKQHLGIGSRSRRRGRGRSRSRSRSGSRSRSRSRSGSWQVRFEDGFNLQALHSSALQNIARRGWLHAPQLLERHEALVSQGAGEGDARLLKAEFQREHLRNKFFELLIHVVACRSRKFRMESGTATAGRGEGRLRQRGSSCGRRDRRSRCRS